jgi:methylated-DNA-[protein]-cysteine S-methyltransferase
MRNEKVSIGKLESTPLGIIWVAVAGAGLVAVEVSPDQAALIAELNRLGFKRTVFDQQQTAAVLKEIEEYLEGERRSFDMQINWSVLTPFQERALRATTDIPYGGVKTYGEIARQLGNPRGARAVGRAEATNPMPLVIPCHRVIGSDGGLHGYGAGEGLKTKAWLLELESSN